MGFLDLGTDLDLSPDNNESSAASDSSVRRELSVLEEDSGEGLDLTSSPSSSDTAGKSEASESGGTTSAGAVLSSVG